MYSAIVKRIRTCIVFVCLILCFRKSEELGKKLCVFKSEDTFKPLMCSINGYMSSGCYKLKNSTLVVDFQHIKYWYEVSIAVVAF